MRIGFVTDEISPDVEEAIRVGTAWGVRDYELRMIGDRRVPEVSPRDVEQMLRLKNGYDIQITAVSPGVFKYGVEENDQLEQELRQTLPATFRLAHMFGAPIVIVFGFLRSEQELPAHEQKVVEIFREVAELAQRQGLVVAVENEPGFWCDSGKNTARILSRVDSRSLRANWDPANAVGTDEAPFPQGYESIKTWLANVHVKDTAKSTLVECVPVGEGKVDWPGQLRALLHDRILDQVTIETHCQPHMEESERNLKVVREMLARCL